MTQIIVAGPTWEGAYPDAARRCADAVNLHVVADPFGAVGKWVAIALADGSSDGVLYDTKADAIRHQADEFHCAYVCIPPGGMPIPDAAVYLRTMRQLYDAGYRLADPDKHITEASKGGVILP